jgi:hypothetical protein
MSRCIRCGKERVVVSSYKKVVVNSEVTYTQTVCSDPECQKMVEKTLKIEEGKRSQQKVEQEERALQRLALKKRNSRQA